MSAFNELDIARAVAEGVLPSPTIWQNASFVALRLSGTGPAWRASVGEFVHRDKAVWCSPEMLRRFLGCPIVIEHPPTGTMTSKFFGDRCVGYVIYTYVNEEEQAPWGVLRCLDSTAASMITGGLFDTSPGIVIDPANCATVEVSGRKLLIEGSPLCIDHVALVYTPNGNRGVWTRDGEPGVQVDAAKVDAAEDCLIIGDMKVIYV